MAARLGAAVVAPQYFPQAGNHMMVHLPLITALVAEAAAVIETDTNVSVAEQE